MLKIGLCAFSGSNVAHVLLPSSSSHSLVISKYKSNVSDDVTTQRCRCIGCNVHAQGASFLGLGNAQAIFYNVRVVNTATMGLKMLWRLNWLFTLQSGLAVTGTTGQTYSTPPRVRVIIIVDQFSIAPSLIVMYSVIICDDVAAARVLAYTLVVTSLV